MSNETLSEQAKDVIRLVSSNRNGPFRFATELFTFLQSKHMSEHMSNTHMSEHMSVHMSEHIYVHMSKPMSVHMPKHMSVHMPVHMSKHMPKNHVCTNA